MHFHDGSRFYAINTRPASTQQVQTEPAMPEQLDNLDDSTAPRDEPTESEQSLKSEAPESIYDGEDDDEEGQVQELSRMRKRNLRSTFNTSLHLEQPSKEHEPPSDVLGSLLSSSAMHRVNAKRRRARGRAGTGLLPKRANDIKPVKPAYNAGVRKRAPKTPSAATLGRVIKQSKLTIEECYAKLGDELATEFVELMHKAWACEDSTMKRVKRRLETELHYKSATAGQKKLLLEKESQARTTERCANGRHWLCKARVWLLAKGFEERTWLELFSDCIVRHKPGGSRRTRLQHSRSMGAEQQLGLSEDVVLISDFPDEEPPEAIGLGLSDHQDQALEQSFVGNASQGKSLVDDTDRETTISPLPQNEVFCDNPVISKLTSSVLPLEAIISQAASPLVVFTAHIPPTMMMKHRTPEPRYVSPELPIVATTSRAMSPTDESPTSSPLSMTTQRVEENFIAIGSEPPNMPRTISRTWLDTEESVAAPSTSAMMHVDDAEVVPLGASSSAIPRTISRAWLPLNDPSAIPSPSAIIQSDSAGFISLGSASSEMPRTISRAWLTSDDPLAAQSLRTTVQDDGVDLAPVGSSPPPEALQAHGSGFSREASLADHWLSGFMASSPPPNAMQVVDSGLLPCSPDFSFIQAIAQDNSGTDTRADEAVTLSSPHPEAMQIDDSEHPDLPPESLFAADMSRNEPNPGTPADEAVATSTSHPHHMWREVNRRLANVLLRHIQGAGPLGMSSIISVSTAPHAAHLGESSEQAVKSVHASPRPDAPGESASTSRSLEEVWDAVEAKLSALERFFGVHNG